MELKISKKLTETGNQSIQLEVDGEFTFFQAQKLAERIYKMTKDTKVTVIDGATHLEVG